MTIPRGLVEPFNNYEEAADDVHDLRLSVYAAEANLLDAKEAYELAEARLVLQAEGKNAEERRANLTLLMAADPDCQLLRSSLDSARRELAAAQANLEREIDRKRSWGWLIRSIGGINGPSATDD